MSSTHPVRTRWPFAALFGIAGALVVGLVVLAFVWPAATAKPRDLPVGIAGPASQVRSFEAALAEQSTRPFDLVTVDSRADAIRRIRHREVYGAVLLGTSPEVLTSSAASTASNQALRGVATSLQQRVAAGVQTALIGKLRDAGTAIAGLQREVAALQRQLRAGAAGGAPTGGAPSSGAGRSAAGGSASTGGAAAGPAASNSSAAPPTVRITDVVALSSDDPNGAGLAAASFPLVLGGMLGGILVSLLVVGAGRRVLALLVYGVAAGTTVTLVLQTWLHVLQRDWIVNAAAFGLAMGATAAFVAGCNALIGRAGIGLGAAVSLLVANPISGAALPYQFLAEPWGTVGQYLVPGAASTLVRSLSYFPDADTRMQWLVLGAWMLGGLLLTVFGHFRSVAPIREPAFELENRTAAA